MSDNNELSRQDRIDELRKEHLDIVLPAEKEGLDDGKYIVQKSKRSQAINSVNNVLQLDYVKQGVRYTFTVMATAQPVGKKDGKVNPEATKSLGKVQDMFDEFLSDIYKYL